MVGLITASARSRDLFGFHHLSQRGMGDFILVVILAQSRLLINDLSSFAWERPLVCTPVAYSVRHARVHPDSTIGCHGVRRTRQFCSTPQTARTRSRTPTFRRRFAPCPMRQRLTRRLTGPRRPQGSPGPDAPRRCDWAGRAPLWGGSGCRQTVTSPGQWPPGSGGTYDHQSGLT